MADIEDLVFEVEEAIFGLAVGQLPMVCTHLAIPSSETEGKPRKFLVRRLQRLVRELGDNEAGAATLAALKDILQGLKDESLEEVPDLHLPVVKDAVEEKPSIPVPVQSMQMIRKELRISGQVGDSSHKDRLTLSSLNHQIDAALLKGYSEAEVVESVLKAIHPSLRLRSYLESCSNLNLGTLKAFLKSHYQEQDATELYQELSQATQGKTESAQSFVMRALDLRQRIIRASEDTTTGLKYDVSLVQNMFIHTIITGLCNDQIRQDLKSSLSVATSDEELLEKLHTAVALESKRQLKAGIRPAARVNVITEDNAEPAKQRNKSQHPEFEMMKGFAAQLAELKACVAALQDRTPAPGPTPADGRPPRPKGCERCREQGRGNDCRHCFKCGSSEHYARGCRKRNQGNGQGSTRGDRV
ncbi:uncharacterized protein LOC121417303 [Lytechinus variegatus]|uniref:uncharacterized protein LOC121417303 n=1 Tax=Lytechinus variegatus TaxID=7654 RepID=UPI001BB1AA10|nr:uncharacterized protein LOC121417303 [Lytechinus variegatus]